MGEPKERGIYPPVKSEKVLANFPQELFGRLESADRPTLIIDRERGEVVVANYNFTRISKGTQAVLTYLTESPGGIASIEEIDGIAQAFGAKGKHPSAHALHELKKLEPDPRNSKLIIEREGFVRLNARVIFDRKEEVGEEQEVGETEPTEQQGRPLSPRGQRILKLVALGYENKEIAETFSLQTSTIKTHMEHILAILEAKNRTQAVIKAIGRGDIELEELVEEGVKDHDPMLVESLARREKQVLQLLATEGLGNAELAERLGISLATVKTYVVHILSKLCVDSRMLVVILYLAYEQRKTDTSEEQRHVAVAGGRVLRLL